MSKRPAIDGFETQVTKRLEFDLPTVELGLVQVDPGSKSHLNLIETIKSSRQQFVDFFEELQGMQKNENKLSDKARQKLSQRINSTKNSIDNMNCELAHYENLLPKEKEGDKQ